ncbi:MAG: PAS domain S-box protein [Verrucomicrobiia bacterium]
MHRNKSAGQMPASGKYNNCKIFKIFFLFFQIFILHLHFSIAQEFLNETERQWLNERKVIRYSPDPNFKPFEYVAPDGSVRGITPDILNAIGRRLNIEFTNVVYKSWNEVLEAIKRGEVDLLGTITKTEERMAYLEFSQPYLNVPVVLFVHKHNPHFANLNNLKGHRVGVVRNYGAESWLKTNHPELQIVTVSTTSEGLLKVALKDLDAFVEVLPVGLEVATEHSLTSIVHSKEPLYVVPQHFAVTKDNKVLLSIIQKGINALPDSEKIAIFNEWSKQRPVEPENLPYYVKVILICLFAGIILAIFLLFSLKKIIDQRTAKLRQSEQMFKNIFHNNPLVAVITTPREGRIIEVNKKFEEISGYKRDELIGRTTLEFGFWVDLKQRTELIERVKKDGVVYNYEAKIKVKGGRILTMLFSVQLFKEDSEELLLWLISDITEMVKTRQREKMLAGIVEATNVLIATADPELNLFYINKAGVKMLGLKNDADALVKKITDILPETNILESAIPEAIKDGIWTGEAELAGENGRLIPVLLTIITHKREDGTIEYLSIIASDISEIKEVQEKLRKSEERIRQIIEHSTQLFYIQDNENRIVYVSPQVREFFGVEPEECIGKNWIDFLSDNPVNQIGIEVTELAIRTGERQRPYELEFIGKNGRRVWVEVNESPLVVNGKVVAIVGSLSDITERKKVEEKLKERETFIEAVAKNSPDYIIVFDIQKQEAIYTNKSPMPALGYDKSGNFTCSEFLSLIHPDDIQKIEKHREELKNAPDGCVIKYEYRVKKKSGDYATFLSRDTVFQRDVAGNARLILSIQQDITEIKKAEAERQKIENQLRQSQKMEAIGKLAGGIAHDFNNILTVINGCVEMLSLDKSIDTESQSLVQDIAKSARRASDLTKQLLMFSRQQVMEPKPLDINQVIRELTKMLKRLIGEHISVVLDLQEGLPLISADRSMIETALTNLSVNARDAMPNGGAITISTTLKQIETEFISKNPEAYKGKFIVVSFADTGMGMGKEIIEKIFEPFFTTKEIGKGTGLGLSVVYSVIKQHGGWVDVESEPGKGAVFKLYFPIPEKIVKTETEKEYTDKCGNLYGNETILVAEDDDQVRQIAVMTLRRFGYNVIEARNGVAALKLCEEVGNKIDLLFTDVIMPGGVSGFELADKVRQFCPDIKIIFSSGYTAEYLQLQADLSQLGLFLKKPYDTIALAKMIRKCLDSSK